MAKPIAFAPKSVDPRLELQHRLEAAPNEHAEALLVVYDLLGEAHRQGILDAMHGAVKARDTIFGSLAEYAAAPESTQALSNLLALGRLLGSIDPERMSRFSREMAGAMASGGKPDKPPTLWQLFRRMREPESRRGLSILTEILASLGRI